MSLEKILERHGYTEEDVKEWAEEAGLIGKMPWPSLIKLFLVKHDVHIPSVRLRGKEVKVVALQPGELSIIKAYVVAEAERRSYTGCPECYKRLEDVEPGEVTECPYCGRTVTAQRFSWRSYLVADETGEILATFPPRIDVELEPGTRVTLSGTLNEFDEFMVRSVSIAETTEEYECSLCGRKLPTKKHLKLHMKWAHGVELPEEELSIVS